MNVPSTHIAGVIGNKCLVFSRINYDNNFRFFYFARLIWAVTISVSGNQSISAVSKEISDGSKQVFQLGYSQPGLGVGVEKITEVRCTQTHEVLQNIQT